MGLSASQARFLQLTARRSNVEYQAQQINFQRLQLSDKLAAASSEYQDKTSNRKLMYAFNNGTGIQKVDLSYANYKSYMNQQMEGISTSQDKYYLVSSSGNKIIVASEEERASMIEANTTRTPLAEIQKAKEDVAKAEADGTTSSLSDLTKSLAKIDLTNFTSEVMKDEQGNDVTYYVERKFNENDFMIVENLDDVDAFQKSIQEGMYYFATLGKTDDGKEQLKTQGWETLGGGAISENYDKTDDAEAEATYKKIQDKIQSTDKKLELQLNKLETERDAIQTEIDSISKVIEDNIEKSFKVFS